MHRISLLGVLLLSLLFTPLITDPRSLCRLSAPMGARHLRNGPEDVTGATWVVESISLNFSYFVARQIWWRRGVFPLRGRAHCLQRCKPLRGLRVSMDTTFDLLGPLVARGQK